MDVVGYLQDLKLHVGQIESKIDDLISLLCQNDQTPKQTVEQINLFAVDDDDGDELYNTSSSKVKIAKLIETGDDPLESEALSKKDHSSCERYSKSSPFKFIEVEFGKYIPISFCHVFSTRNFHVHSDYTKLKDFYIEITERYTEMSKRGLSNVSLNCIKLNKLYCYFFSEDESYYRVQVIDFEQDRIKINYVDFFDIHFGDIENLYELLPEFEQTPIFALNCFLDGIIYI